MYQILREGATATYDNVVEIDVDLDELVGTYSCSVFNSAGPSNVATVNVHGEISTVFVYVKLHSILFIVLGIRITGNEESLILGSSAQFICSSDLQILVAEWLYDDRVIVQVEASQANLFIPTVNDSLHMRQYVCRITTPYGVQEQSTMVTVTGMYTVFT